MVLPENVEGFQNGAGVGGAAVGLGGDTHTDKAAEAGEETAGQEREGHEPSQQL